MGSCSTNHIIVTKRLMARKKAQRAYINEKIKKAYLGKFGDLTTNKLADKFRTKPLLVKKSKSDLSMHRKMDIFFYHNDDWYSSGCSFLGNTLG